MDIMERYDRVKRKVVVRREPFHRFLRFLEEKTSWLTAPASARYHLAEEQGLLKHSIGVTETLLALRGLLAGEIAEESCVIVGLFHDVGKVGMPGKPLYLPGTHERMAKNRGICYTTNPDVVVMGLALRSLYLVTQYIPLSETEAQAIAYHDGQYIDANRIIAHREEPLTLLLHWADYWTAHICEEGRPVPE